MAALLATAMLGAETTDYMAARNRAEKLSIPLVVLVGADWCQACQVMKNKVLPEIAAEGWFRHAAYGTINVDKEPKLAAKLVKPGDAIPQLIFFYKKDGKWLARRAVGAQSVKNTKLFIADGLLAHGYRVQRD